MTSPRIFPTAVSAAMVLMLAFCLAPHGAGAHSSSQAYIQAEATDQGAVVRWHLAATDLNIFVPLDHNLDGGVTWSEIEAVTAIANKFALDRVIVQSTEITCRKRADDLLVSRRNATAFIVFTMHFECAGVQAGLPLRYRGLWPTIHDHRAHLEISGMKIDHILTEKQPDFILSPH